MKAFRRSMIGLHFASIRKGKPRRGRCGFAVQSLALASLTSWCVGRERAADAGAQGCALTRGLKDAR